MFSIPENLLVEISGALGTKESHFLSWNMFWENAVEYLRNDECLELSNLCHCVQHPRKLIGRDCWSSRNERKPLSKLKHVLRKCSGVSQKWWMLELSNLCHCVQHPWNLLVEISGALGTERKPLSELKHVLRKCSGVSEKWWMLELSNCAIVFSTPENLLVEISGALGMKESHFLSKNVFWENAVGYLRNSEC